MKKLVPLFLIFVLMFAVGCSSERKSKEPLVDTDTVYISRTGKIHIFDDCSGMKYYEEMEYGKAKEEGYHRCKICFD